MGLRAPLKVKNSQTMATSLVPPLRTDLASPCLQSYETIKGEPDTIGIFLPILMPAILAILARLCHKYIPDELRDVQPIQTADGDIHLADEFPELNVDNGVLGGRFNLICILIHLLFIVYVPFA